MFFVTLRVQNSKLRTSNGFQEEQKTQYRFHENHH